ncbi:MAG: hypothetical protein WEB53_02070 [Akkermansiaceae bacterium]
MLAPSKTAVFELYDHAEAPDETKNLASERPAIVAELKKLLATHPEAKPQIIAKGQAAAKPKGKTKGKGKNRERNPQTDTTK